MKCKSQTKDKDVKTVKTNNRLMEKSVCADCGTKKNKFVSQQKGKGIEADLSKEVYNKNPKEEIQGFKLDKELSNKKTLTYHNTETKKTIISHKGTDPKA